MTLGFFKIKTDFERKKISGHRINSGRCDGSLRVIKKMGFQKCLQQQQRRWCKCVAAEEDRLKIRP
jgi:hypothetical protein